MSPATAKTRSAQPAPKSKAASRKSVSPSRSKPRIYPRFHWVQRLAHILLLTSFTLLAATGLPQKYALHGWAQSMIRGFGGIETTRIIHHSAAAVLLLLIVYHGLDVSYKIFVRRTRLTMLPGVQDLRDGWQSLTYNLGIGKKRPQMGRYSWEEKLEYWALVWGTIIMAITGFMMWNPITTTRLLPGEIIPAAKAAHGGEAFLAVAAIILWHMYSVHIKRFNKSMFTGTMTEEEMLHEHPLELADIKAGLAERPIDPQTLRKRQRIFWPIAILLALGVLVGIYFFINGEQTAITTVSALLRVFPG